jgi:uncharacterized membrane protein YdbT with pleckstrin-like domain
MEIQSDENIIIYIRKHWLRFVIQLFPIAVLAMLPIVFPGAATFFLPIYLTQIQNAIWALYFMWLIVLWVWAFEMWTEYYLDMWVLTNKKIVSADQRSLFNRHMSTLELEKIQDITVEVDGFIETMLEYGTLRVQTAGEMREFVMDDAAHAEKCKQLILDAQANVREDILKRQSGYMANGVNY